MEDIFIMWIYIIKNPRDYKKDDLDPTENYLSNTGRVGPSHQGR